MITEGLKDLAVALGVPTADGDNVVEVLNAIVSGLGGDPSAYKTEEAVRNLAACITGKFGETTTIEVTPTTSEQEITPDDGYIGFSKVTVAAVTAAIDENIVAENIKDGVTILGVTGSYT